jgi:hypothetical protein
MVATTSGSWRGERRLWLTTEVRHLNDLSRRHSDIVVETAAAWLADPDENTQMRAGGLRGR